MSDLVRPHAGRPLGSKNSAMQARAVRTRESILAVAAQCFDVGGYGNTSINAILDVGNFAKGAFYYHFPTKESIAQQIVTTWGLFVEQSVREATTARSDRPAVDQLTALFIALAGRVAVDTGLRAGMKLTLESSVDGAAAFGHWVGAVSGIVETASAAGELTDTPTTRRLAWNLCASTVGVAHAAATLAEDVDLTVRINDMVTAHLRSVRT